MKEKWCGFIWHLIRDINSKIITFEEAIVIYTIFYEMFNSKQ